MDDILFEENHCTKPSVIELGSLFTQCANCFARSLCISFRVDIQDHEKTDGKKKNNLKTT